MSVRSPAWVQALAACAKRVLLAGLALAAVFPVRAMSVIPPTFSELVGQATQIVRVEIVEVHSQFDLGPDGSVPINTYVRCRVLKTLKGAAQETITLRLLGGEVGDVGLAVPGMPKF